MPDVTKTYISKEGQKIITVRDTGDSYYISGKGGWNYGTLPKSSATIAHKSHCIFCGKVKKRNVNLVKLESGHFIHDECIDAMVMILLRNKPKKPSTFQHLSAVDTHAIFGLIGRRDD